MMQDLEVLESKFSLFLDRTIIGASKNYYKKQMRNELRELKIIDDENYGEYLKKFIAKKDESLSNALGEFGQNYVLNLGIESLSNIEKTVIFLYFKQKYKVSEIASILMLKPDTITKIKRRALNKLKNYMEGIDENE